MRTLIIFAVVYLGSALALASERSSFLREPFREPTWIFTAGPGTVIAVRMQDLPFGPPRFTVKFRTDNGEQLELWRPVEDAPVFKGMHGTLVYSTHPDRIIEFRVQNR